ncbi:MAG: molybdenum cofactor guanylyltransferase [Gammaproteobacteria bacterium]|nr:molybdenum cofactor guanylyltransferase [Gammaproteobacteria bacterium]MBL6998291.1 molybdenum cofactor guanylyltransferase [Gammaproteobacteria bacterium]
MKSLKSADITAVILAGGRGSRMGGQDKGLVRYQHQTLIAHVLTAVSQQTGQIVINANRNRDEYAALGYPVVEDSLNDFQGPLAGFLACMSSVKSTCILTLPCDGPLLAPDYLQRMMQAKNRSGCDIAIASDGERMQPVYALIPVSLQHSLQQYLAAGDRKIDLWYRQHSIELVDFSDQKTMFTNINSPEDMH